ncbi:MAG: hypothetical protein JKY65_02175, partial [Planctomycetes bacterium]|nr:hypothetical protein [Planctomycetota bacterium]
LRYLEPAEARDLLTRLSPCDPAQEESPEVRAALTVPLAALSRAAKPGEEGLELWKRALLREPHPLPRDHLLSSLGDLLEELVGAERLPREVGEELLLECAHEAARAEWPLAQRRQIEDALERVAVTALGAFERFRETLLPALDALSCGQALRLEDDGLEPVDLGRLLSWAARTGEGLYAQETRDGFRIVSGPRRELRAWRLLHEARTPSPDKRTGFSHATGSRRPGTIRAHSMTLAEASPAGVPGEPVAIASEGGSRPFLPLVDDFYDCLRDGPSRLYSAQGIVSLAEPAGWRAQARAWLGLTLHYEALAGLREQCRLDNPEVSPAAFVERTRGLGFEVVFVPHLPQALSTAAAYFGALASAEDDAPLEQESRGGGA